MTLPLLHRVTVSAALVLLVGASTSACQVPGAGGEAGASHRALPADLVVVGGRVWTGNPNQPWAEAVAVTGERITAVGSREDIEALADADTRVIDVAGGLVTPGFIDSHVHFLDGGLQLASVQLRDAATPDEFARRIGEFARTVPAGTWILGGDWDHTLWGGDLPRRDWIDSLTRAHPVFVRRLDGHMGLANTLALEAAGISASTPDIDGGEVVRDAGGEPTGVFKDNAMALVDRAIPAAGPAELDRALAAASDYVAARGVTSVHHMGGWDGLATFRRAAATGRLATRIYACVPLSQWERLRDTVAASGRGDAWLRIGCLKGFADGSLGSHTAAFLEPYTDTPGESGLLVTKPEVLGRRIVGAAAAGLQVNVHAIGDRAIREILDVYGQVAAADRVAAAENGAPLPDRRFRVEHAQHIDPSDIPRFGELGAIASMQPYHAIDDGRWAEGVIGHERALTTYAFRSLLDSGARLAFGSDWFVAPPTVLEGIYAAVTRRTLDGANPGGWIPEERITVEEALAAYTRDAAFASFEEDIKGSIEAGKLADLVVIDRDLTAIPPGEIADAKVRATIIGGRVAWEAGAGATP